MSALLNWNTFVPAEREEIGMVAELCGPNGSLSLIPSNLTNEIILPIPFSKAE